MYFIDSKFGINVVAALTTKQKMNYAVITRTIQVSLYTTDKAEYREYVLEAEAGIKVL